MSAGLPPAEMILPVLCTRMEQSGILTGERVVGGGTIRLREIAGSARQRAIGFVVRASQCEGNDVLQMKMITAGVLRRLAVFATRI